MYVTSYYGSINNSTDVPQGFAVFACESCDLKLWLWCFIVRFKVFGLGICRACRRPSMLNLSCPAFLSEMLPEEGSVSQSFSCWFWAPSPEERLWGLGFRVSWLLISPVSGFCIVRSNLETFCSRFLFHSENGFIQDWTSLCLESHPNQF